MTPHYRRVRRVARELGLRDSLAHIWAYSLHVGYGRNLDGDYLRSLRNPQAKQVRDYIHEFHLDLHAREVLLHAGKDSLAKRSLKNWVDLAEFHNSINKHSDKTSGAAKEVFLALHRIGHQQISSFDRVDARYLGRYWSLFRQQPLADFIEQSFGMTALEYFLLVAGAFMTYMTKPESDLVHDLAPLEIPPKGMRERLAVVSASPSDVRRRLAHAQRFDGSWAYTFNELNRTPLLRLRSKSPDLLFCARPQLLIRRLLAGAYFDLVAKRGFSDAFGDGVEELVGDLIRRSDRRLSPAKPVAYSTGAGVRHGTDWLLSDKTGHIFVECKSARIPLQAQVAPDAADVSKGMDRLADAIVQNYSNINDALSGLGEFKDDGLPVFSLVVTFEDWNLFSPIASESLKSLVEQKLCAKRLEKSLLSTSPYIVVSVRDLPNLTNAMAHEGIAPVLTRKCEDRYEQYLVSSFLSECKYNVDRADTLFKAASDELFAEFRARHASRSASTGSLP